MVQLRLSKVKKPASLETSPFLSLMVDGASHQSPVLLQPDQGNMLYQCRDTVGRPIKIKLRCTFDASSAQDRTRSTQRGKLLKIQFQIVLISNSRLIESALK